MGEEEEEQGREDVKRNTKLEAEKQKLRQREGTVRKKREKRKKERVRRV